MSAERPCSPSQSCPRMDHLTAGIPWLIEPNRTGTKPAADRGTRCARIERTAGPLGASPGVDVTRLPPGGQHEEALGNPDGRRTGAGLHLPLACAGQRPARPERLARRLIRPADL